jgi:hypothetical protein
MSDHDATRARRQRLIFLMEKHGMGHPNYHAWEAEYKALRPQTSAPRNSIDARCRVDARYPERITSAETERREGRRKHNAAVKGKDVRL